MTRRRGAAVSDSTLTARKRRSKAQWGVASTALALGIGIALASPTIASAVHWIQFGVPVGAFLIGIAVGVIALPLEVTNSPSDFADRPSRFLEEARQRISQDDADFLAALAPGLRGSAYDQAMHDLEELIGERRQVARAFIGASDSSIVLDAVASFYDGWLKFVDAHYEQRQREEAQERAFEEVDYQQSRALEAQVVRLRSDAISAISTYAGGRDAGTETASITT